MNKIHDIKSLVEIPDFSLYVFAILCFLLLCIVASLIFLIYKTINNKKKNCKKEYYQILKNMDFSNPKEASYKISKYLRLLDQKETSLIMALIKDLDEYKYKKNVKQIDKNILNKFEIIMETIDV